GNRNAATWAIEFLTTEIASSAWPLAASTTPTACSTALPAVATITSPANEREMPRVRIDGSSACTNQSETKAAATPARTNRVRLTLVGTRGVSPVLPPPGALVRYW